MAGELHLWGNNLERSSWIGLEGDDSRGGLVGVRARPVRCKVARLTKSSSETRDLGTPGNKRIYGDRSTRLVLHPR